MSRIHVLVCTNRMYAYVLVRGLARQQELGSKTTVGTKSARQKASARKKLHASFHMRDADSKRKAARRRPGRRAVNLAQLTYFCHLAKTEHYTRSAESLHVTQSALSHSIAALERELGCALFCKVGRNVQLTDDGRVFLKYISEGLASIDRGVAELDRRHGSLSGTINVGAIATVRSGYLPAAMQEFRSRFGDKVEFHVLQGETAPLNDKLEQGICDLVIAGPVQRPGIACTTLFHQRLVVAVHREHPLAALKKVRYENLIGHTVITYRRGIACGETLETFLRNTNAPLEKLTLVRNYEDEVILGALAVHESSVALTMLTSNLPPDSNMVILPLDVPGSEDFYPISLTRREEASLNPATQAFIDFLLEYEAPAYERPDFVESE